MPLPSTIDEFLEVVVKSGVLEKDVLDPYLQQMRAAGNLPDRPKKLAAALVRDGLLTSFQVAQFLQGKWRGFCISGKYKLLDHLGAGGMGSVFLCEHKSMRRRVAIKVLPVAQAKDPASLEASTARPAPSLPLTTPTSSAPTTSTTTAGFTSSSSNTSRGPVSRNIVKRGGPMDVTARRPLRPPGGARPAPRRTWPDWSTATSNRPTSCWTGRASSRSSTWAWHGSFTTRKTG